MAHRVLLLVVLVAPVIDCIILPEMLSAWTRINDTGNDVPNEFISGYFRVLRIVVPDPAPMDDYYKDLGNGWKLTLEIGLLSGLSAMDRGGDAVSKWQPDNRTHLTLPIYAKPSVTFRKYTVETTQGVLASGKLTTNPFVTIMNYHYLGATTCDLIQQEKKIVKHDPIEITLSNSGAIRNALTNAEYEKFMDDLKNYVLEAAQETMFKAMTYLIKEYETFCPISLLQKVARGIIY